MTTSNLTLTALAELMAELPPAPKWIAASVRPEFAIIIKNAVPKTEEPVHPNACSGSYALAGGIEIHEKRDQHITGWLFTDRQILEDYLKGKLTEFDLFELTRTNKTAIITDLCPSPK